ncbi:glycosyltransferase [Bradyrhizobium sp. DASA03007]|uniref:glycosyltransferase n=1 Tax=Bradyrhizobium sp. SPXBL-03 TaxID=3395913 RepID=UPI003F6E5369
MFSALYREAQRRAVNVTFYQIAETEVRRAALAPVDLSWHQYPFSLLFKGAYSKIPKSQLFATLLKHTWLDHSDLTILNGYEKPEVWLQVLILILRRKKFAWFCDSTIHDKPQALLTGIGKRILFGLSSGIFCYGKRSAEYVIHYGVSPNRAFPNCQAAALPRDYSPEEVIVRRQNSAARRDSPRYLYVGRLSPEKSLENLIQAFSRALTHYPEAKLVLVGQGPEQEKLERICDALGITARVEFTGSKVDQALFDEYLKATCLVLPSRSEPWGLVVNESLSYGCPVVVSDRCGCVPELVIPERTGFPYSWSDIQELTQRLVDAPIAFEDIAVTARSCLLQIAPFTPEAAARSILDGCERIITASGSVLVGTEGQP